MKATTTVFLTLVLIFGMFSTVTANVAIEPNLDSTNKLGPGLVDLNDLTEEERNKIEKRMEELDKYFIELMEKESEINILQEKKSNNNISAMEFQKLNELLVEFEKLNNNSEEIVGLTEVEVKSDEQNNGINSTEEDITISRPVLYKDTWTNRWVIRGNWKWDGIYNDTSVGGLDAFSLGVLQERITIFGDQLSTRDYMGCVTTPSVDTEPSSYGISMTFQDYFNDCSVYYQRGYSATSGVGFLYFDFYNGIPKGKTINIIAHYAHTWSSTTINSIGVGRDSISVGWSKDSHKWKDHEYAYVSF